MLSVILYSTQNVQKLRQTLTSLSQFAKYPGDIEVLVVTHTEDSDTWEAVEGLNLRTDTWVVTSRQDFKDFRTSIFKEAANICIGDRVLFISDDTSFNKSWDSFLSNDLPVEDFEVMINNHSHIVGDRKRFVHGSE